ncbi:MAG TPA: type I methionyl aminopeptidase, partial [Acinetobacter ursingii]|nr:type I methionyl aminopeptidase [Acinetobacter ursingii]
MRASTVTIKTEQDIENLRVSGRLAAQVLEMIADHIKPGVSTEYLDDICHDYIVNTLQVIPANVG